MSFPPFGYGLRRSSPVDPFFVDPSYSDLSFPGFGDDSAFSAVADARVDWKETREARVFKADLPGRHKRGVKVEVDGSAVQITGERNCKREKKTDTRHRVDWKETGEARVFKADIPGRHKRSVKVEVDGSAVQISGERNCKREKKTDTRHRVDWKETREARVFKADLPGRHKRSVKVEVDGSAVQISGERNCKREKKIDTRHCVEREKKIETRHRIEREKTTETWHRVEREKKTETWHHVESEKKTDTRPRVASEKKTNSAEVLRRFRLPANVKADQIKVAMENRMLTVTVPKVGIKQPVKKPSGKSIKISG